jgi:hypothetical protein
MAPIVDPRGACTTTAHFPFHPAVICDRAY